MSFKLDRLAPANGFDHEHAHDALADVLATVHLAKLIRHRAPKIWTAAMNTRTKLAAGEFVEREPLFVATTIRFSRCLSRMVAPLGINPENGGELLTLDLRQDPTPLGAMCDDDLAAHLRTSPRPVQPLKLNACPLFVPLEIAGSKTGGYELGLAELGRRAARRPSPSREIDGSGPGGSSSISGEHSCRGTDL